MMMLSMRWLEAKRSHLTQQEGLMQIYTTVNQETIQVQFNNGKPFYINDVHVHYMYMFVYVQHCWCKVCCHEWSLIISRRKICYWQCFNKERQSYSSHWEFIWVISLADEMMCSLFKPVLSSFDNVLLYVKYAMPQISISCDFTREMMLFIQLL